tara:strand:+ start:378 stop:557 length:180 start_codon:yes stop_codon:yes gene_type:complete
MKVRPKYTENGARLYIATATIMPTLLKWYRVIPYKNPMDDTEKTKDNILPTTALSPTNI